MSFEETLREQMIAALQSPEGQAAIRSACSASTPVPAPVPRLPAGRLKIRHAAQLAGNMHPDTLRRAIKAKKLRAQKPAGSREWLIDARDLQCWLSGEKSAVPVDIRGELEKSLRHARGTGR